MFSIGDKVVYPMHGAGTIESIEEKEMFGDTAEYYIIKMPVGDMKLMVPTETAEYIYENNWNRRYKANVDKIKTGDILEVADVVRDLSHRHMERGLSTAEKKMLTSAKEILISELMLAQGLEHAEVDREIEEKVKFSYDLGTM